jgi:hypothetical protein
MTSGRGGQYGVGGSKPSGSRIVSRPLTKGEKVQNKSAKTYITKTTVKSEAAAARDAATSKRMAKTFSKAKSASIKTGVGTVAGFGTGAMVGKKSNGKNKFVRPGKKG